MQIAGRIFKYIGNRPAVSRSAGKNRQEISVNPERNEMGGFGSTRWAWTSTKDTVEGSRFLDINRLNRAGCLRPGCAGGWEWTRDGEGVASIWFRRDSDRLVLSYRVRPHGGEWQDVEQRIQIVWRPCRLGGARPYFVCRGIVNRIACGRRVAKLYEPEHISVAVTVIGSPMLLSAKIATTEPCAGPIKFACGLAESQAWRRDSQLGQRACTARLTSAFNPLH
jgi:hypothetical protein